MKSISKLCLTIILTIANSLLICPLEAQEPEELRPVESEIDLFNGKDLDDWIFYSRKDNVDREQVWQVEDGVLKCNGKPSGYLQTKRWYRDYELELEWRWPGEKGGNSGVLIHTTTPQLFFGWPKSLEVQLQAGSAGDFWVIGKAVDVRVENETLRRKKPKPGNQHSHRRIRRLEGEFENKVGEWNRMKIICQKDRIQVFVNDQLANDGTSSTVSEGAISLQSEGTAIEFRKVRIRPLAE